MESQIARILPPGVGVGVVVGDGCSTSGWRLRILAYSSTISSTGGSSARKTTPFKYQLTYSVMRWAKEVKPLVNWSIGLVELGTSSVLPAMGNSESERSILTGVLRFSKSKVQRM